MINLIKSAWLTIAFLCVFGLSSFTLDNVEAVSFYSNIEQDGDFLISTADDPDDEILSVILTEDQGMVYEFSGCKGSQCSHNISKLPKGNYEVLVITKFEGYYGEVYK